MVVLLPLDPEVPGSNPGRGRLLFCDKHLFTGHGCLYVYLSLLNKNIYMCIVYFIKFRCPASITQALNDAYFGLGNDDVSV